MDRPFVGNVAQPWFAVQVWAGREQHSAKQLRARGHDVFLPCHIERRAWSDRVKCIECALFTGYVFCRLDAVAAGKIITAPGVIRIVGNSDGPLPVSNEEIETIRHIVDARIPVEPWPFLTAGQRVRVDDGPLRGAEGIVVTIKNQHRLVVSIRLLQRSVAVELNPAWLSAAPAVLSGHAAREQRRPA